MTAPPDGGEAAPPVRIVIVNYNAGAHLERAVRAALAQTGPAFELVVVDNGSTDGSLDGLPANDPRLEIRRMGANLGFAAGNNRGAEGAAGNWLATLNPDAFPEPGWLAALFAAAARHPATAMFGSNSAARRRARDPRRGGRLLFRPWHPVARRAWTAGGRVAGGWGMLRPLRRRGAL